MIATFEDEPYRAPFSGNVIELCPVGALTSTQYRFEARPWEIQNVPTVCGLCPVGCNISRDDARGQGQAHPLAQPPRGRRGLALRQGPLRVRAPARGRPHRRSAAQAPATASSRSLGRGARRGRAAAARGRAVDRDRALRHGDGRAGLRRSRSSCASGSARTRRCCPEEVPDGLDRFRAPLSSIRDAQVVVVLGDEPVVERAPIVDLWIKAARRNGARVLSELPEETVEGARAGHRRRRARRAGSRATSAPTAAFYLPRTPNGARRRRRVERRRRRRAGRRRADRAADRLRRRGRRRPERARARRARRAS